MQVAIGRSRSIPPPSVHPCRKHERHGEATVTLHHHGPFQKSMLTYSLLSVKAKSHKDAGLDSPKGETCKRWSDMTSAYLDSEL